MKQEQLEFLNKTIKKYTSKNRAYNSSLEVCTYTPTGISPGCAIGSEVPINIAEKLQEKNYSLDSHESFDLLPDKLKKLGKDFLRDIQGLHDDEDNWDENGLSQEGLVIVETIKKEHHLN